VWKLELYKGSNSGTKTTCRLSGKVRTVWFSFPSNKHVHEILITWTKLHFAPDQLVGSKTAVTSAEASMPENLPNKWYFLVINTVWRLLLQPIFPGDHVLQDPCLAVLSPSVNHDPLIYNRENVLLLPLWMLFLLFIRLLNIVLMRMGIFFQFFFHTGDPKDIFSNVTKVGEWKTRKINLWSVLRSFISQVRSSTDCLACRMKTFFFFNFFFFVVSPYFHLFDSWYWYAKYSWN
jgi:hypothetical protein